MCRCSRHLVGKVVIVTGGSSGIGYETAKNLADRGARVLIAGNSETRGTAARDEIIKATGNTDVHFRRVDFASLVSVRAFASNILSTEKSLDILINNAGILLSNNVKTEDGLLEAMQVNYFGPFLLTKLLLPLLKSSAPSRIINVSSMAYQFSKIDLDDLNWEKRTSTFNSNQVYSDSKLALVLMTTKLARELEGTGVTINSLHPGYVHTKMDLDKIGPLKYLAFLGKLVTKSTFEAAQTSIYLAVSPEVEGVSGRYFRDCRETNVTKLAQDNELADKLWKISEQIVESK
ncbi:short chain dehydrogenase domain-containing protein [Phthorimaea operculella]|nr:short chain dehydrogenase domain-containing protein [Phthorimaea operculella]